MAAETKAQKQRLKGMKIRDEFLCPITYELLREPVVASDGHTYEKAAIERWLKTENRTTSPRTGEDIDETIISNISLKKLIQDLINEGGAGLYMEDMTDKSGRTFDVCRERLIVMTCMGPAESEWNSQSFQVHRNGCVGGRGLMEQDARMGKDVVRFSDTIVSRRHFEISAIPGASDLFGIRDLGSVGGTFIRVPFGEKKELHPGMILLLGKHQFTVSSIIDSAIQSADNKICDEASSAKQGGGGGGDDMTLLVHDAETLIHDIALLSQQACAQRHTHSEGEDPAVLSKRLKALTTRLSLHMNMQDDKSSTDSKRSDRERDRPMTPVMGGSASASGVTMPRNGSGVFSSDEDEQCKSDKKRPNATGTVRLCTLTCCQPDGSPLQGKSFVIGPDGGTMGRRPHCTVGIVATVMSGNDMKMVTVDSAVSLDHARITADAASGRFFLCDGSEQKPSTNGVWCRLSGPHQESSLQPLLKSMEVLVGNIRFQCQEAVTIAERVIDGDTFATAASSNEGKE